MSQGRYFHYFHVIDRWSGVKIVHRLHLVKSPQARPIELLVAIVVLAQRNLSACRFAAPRQDAAYRRTVHSPSQPPEVRGGWPNVSPVPTSGCSSTSVTVSKVRHPAHERTVPYTCEYILLSPHGSKSDGIRKKSLPASTRWLIPSSKPSQNLILPGAMSTRLDNASS